MAVVRFVTLSVAFFSVPCDASGPTSRINLLKRGVLGEDAIKVHLEQELADIARDSPQGRLRAVEDALRPMYAALPKNAEGTLDHLPVRYALHRFFNNQSGWFIRGLEPNGAPSSGKPADELEWIPNFLQEQLEQRLGGKRGATLEQLAALAAALEDLARDEAQGRLEGVFELHGFQKSAQLTEPDMLEVLETFYIGFLVAGKFSVSSMEELHRRKARFFASYAGWAQAEEWFNTLLAKSLPKADRAVGSSFEQLLRAVDDLGKKYYDFNDVECNDLKQTLRGMEGRKPGRVRLGAFYNQGLYSHWRFTEKADYLKSLGALDVSDPQRPYVIIANYAMARPNCLDSSKLYAICCRNDCESLMSGLEADIGSAAASPQRVAELVTHLPSAFSQAPRNLSAALTSRLDEVAKQNGGEVPLHGRLFAQFMHHVFPLECPYPHEKGTIMTQMPAEWLRQNADLQKPASPEEMLHHVERDNCAVSTEGKVECAGETAELPWTSGEELLVSRRRSGVSRRHGGDGGEAEDAAEFHEDEAQVADDAGARHRRTGVYIFLLLSVVAAAVAMAQRQRCMGLGRLVPHLKDDDAAEPSVLAGLITGIAWRPLVAVLALALLALTLDLVNGFVVLCGALCGVVVLVTGSLSRRRPTLPRAKFEDA